MIVFTTTDDKNGRTALLNCVPGGSRNLKIGDMDQPMYWQHIINLHEVDLHSDSASVTKLSKGATHPSRWSKMNVNDALSISDDSVICAEMASIIEVLLLYSNYKFDAASQTFQL
jgi:hypothetical protein